MEHTTKEKDTEISFVKPSKKASPTRFLFVSKADISDPNLAAELISIFSRYGDLDETMGPVYINHKRHVCYVCFQDKGSCQKALLATQCKEGMSLSGGVEKLICKYADVERPVTPPPEPECISTTEGVDVPGLTVMEEFVSEEEERFLLDFCDTRNADTVKAFSKGKYVLARNFCYCESLLSALCLPCALCLDGKKERKKKGGYWEKTISRRVQHFGYRFNYDTRLLDAPRNMCTVPSFFSQMVKEKLKDRAEEKEKEEEPIMTQMTINEYYPGQGISSHIGERASCQIDS